MENSGPATNPRAALVESLASTIAHESGGTAAGWTLTVEIVLTALSAKLADLGLRIMPAEATEAMTINGCAIPGVSLETGRRMYRAMLAASPDPLAQEASDA